MKTVIATFAMLLLVSFSGMAAKQKSSKVAKAQQDSIAVAQRVQTVRDSLNAILDKAKAGDADAMNEVGTWYYNGKHVQRDYKAAYEWWKNASLKSNVRAIANLGLCYQLGHGVDKDSVDAIRLYKKSIKQKNKSLFDQRAANASSSAFDAMLIASCYEDGTGCIKDYAKAADFYELAARKGSVDAMRQAGVCLLNAKRNPDAFKYFEKAAAKGDISSQYWAGKMLLGNMGVAPDKQQAVVYILKAADNGMPAAQNELGELYAAGNGVTKNEKQASQWFLEAATGGNAKAAWNYANALRVGSGTDKNFDQALAWMAVAAPLGYQRAFKKLVAQLDSVADPFACYVNGMKRYLVDGNFKEANADFKKLEKAKIDEGKIMQAVILASKRNEKPNARKAAQILEKLPDNPEALFYLATLYESGNGVSQSMPKAIELYRKSADLGYGKAQCYLADIFYEGRGIDKDLITAVSLYRKALLSHQLSRNGAMRLADCFESGAGGLDVDKRKAAELRDYKEPAALDSLLKAVVN